jgi:hypothetical protein
LIRPALALVLTLSALKLLDVPNEVLGVLLVVAMLAGGAAWYLKRRRAHALHAPREAPTS